MKKGTAVEWLISKLMKSKDYQRVINDVNHNGTELRDVINEALAIEKEQIITAYLDGADACDLEVKGDRVLLVKPDTNLSGQEYFYQNY